MKVVNLRQTKDYTTYIGRGSVFGNPFVIGKDGDRDEVIQKYERYARSNSLLMRAIHELDDEATLACYCKPLPCHGDIIIKLRGEQL